MPELQDTVPAFFAGSPRPVSSMQPSGAVGVREQTQDAPSPPPPRKRAPGDPVAACLYSLAFGEAPCVGLVGDRGSGKSTAMRALAAGYLSRSVGIVVACDKGGSSGFPGQRRRDLADLRLHPIDPEPRALVFTGDPWAGIEPDPEEAARLAWRLAGKRCPVLLAVDELKWAARGGWWRRGIHWLPQACSEGRKHGVGILWGSQSPQDAPREAFEEAGVIVCYRLAGLGLDRLEDRGYLTGIDRRVIEALPGDDAAPAARGRCVLLRRGRPWDRAIYRFPA